MSNEKNTPPRVKPKLTAKPKIRNLYWCDFPQDAHLPEFWKLRPVIVISKNHDLSGHATVVATTTKPQPENNWAVQLKTSIDGRQSWAICDKPCTVAVSRLVPSKSNVTRLPQDEFNQILDKLWEWLPVKPPKKT
jgi:mRNA interferase MazF